MKKYLPIIIFAVGLLVFVGGFIFVRSRQSSPSTTPSAEDEIVADIPFEKRPYVSLTPSEDGHWLTFKMENIRVDGASSVDYQLLYDLPDSRQQGTGGNKELDSESFEKELLLGSESSGKYRYDEGVEQGTLTLKFRNDKGKLVGKLATDWHLQSDTKELSSVDGSFQFSLGSIPKGVYFVTMQTFGVPQMPDGFSAKENQMVYGIFNSSSENYSGSPTPSDVLNWNGKSWQNDSFETGVYLP